MWSPRLDGFDRRLALIAAAALAIRVLYTLVLASSWNGPHATGDIDYYHRVAGFLAEGKGFINPFLYREGLVVPSAEHPPLWPALLGVASWLGLDSMRGQRLVGCPIGALVVVAIGLLGRRVGGERVGLTAAGIAAVYPILIAADGSLMSETLYGLGVAAVLLATLRVREHPTVRRAAVAGALIGATALVRPEILALGAVVLAPVAWRAARARRVQRVAAVGLAAALVIAPWTIRNAARFDRFVLVSTNDGTVIRGANCDQVYRGRDIGFWTFTCFTLPLDLNEAKLSARWRSEGIEYALDNAERLPVVLLAREARTWDLYQPRRQLDFAEGRNRAVEGLGVLVFYGLAALAIAGFVQLRRRRHPDLLILASPIAMVAVMSLATYGYTRFRHAAEIPIVVLAAVAIERWSRSRALRAANR